MVTRDRQFTEGRQNYFLVGPPCFDGEQIARLRALVDEFAQPAEVAESGPDGASEPQYQDGRRTRVRSLHPDEHRWVYEIIEACFSSANQYMRCEIEPDMNDPIQLLRYDADEAGHFRWHSDVLPSDMTRKISVVVPLSEADEFDGGELQFNQGGTLCAVGQSIGRPIAFPSWLIHQVTPVTRGRRYSLVAWVRGPNWR